MQKDSYAIRDYTSCFRQPMPSFIKCSRLSPLIEEYKPHFPHYQYDHPVDSLHRFHEAFASGSHRRKSAPSKMPNDIDTKDINGQVESSNEEDKHFLSSPFHLLYHLPPLSTYDAKMIELSNIGLQYCRTMDPFWLNSLKQESIRTNIMWPPGHLYLHPSYPYFHKQYPETMFPFQIPTPSFHMCHSLNVGLSDKGVISKTQTDESEDPKQTVERVDINIQIDDSFYVEVGDQKRWKCPTCEKSYTSKYNLVTHILGHNGIKPHSCAHCGKLFKQLSHLHTHMLTHQGTRPHKCQVCNKAFTQTSHLKRHMMQHSDVKPYNCRICGRGFAYPSELKVHEAKHENGRENICVECGLDFPTLVQLKRHLTVHRGPVQYNCTECDKTFQYPSQLQNHMMKHKDIRPYICSECGMEFVQPHHLKQHSLTHKLCGKEFNRMHNLMGHMHLHSDSKPFKCLYCPSKFTLKGNLTRHMKVKHGVTERGYHSRGLSRGRAGLSHSIVLRSLEQKEPFDLSRKRRVKELSRSLDGERIKGNYFQEEEEEDQSSISTMHKLDVHCESEHGFEEHHNVMKVKCNKEKYNLHIERDAEKTSHHHHKEEEEAFTAQNEGTLGLSVPDYLYFKNRNTTET
ncbi:zinc finger protein 366 isoform X2 [Aquarana catesbeiana]|uniref:zinc finger protein 366 isoform X2 n=1 Tax=Aquarana catesbeiana TaxID=8400 RepID=UPI003CC9FDBD